MRRLFLVLALLCFGVQPLAAQDQSDRGVRAAFDRFIRGFNNLDWPLVQGYFAETVTVFHPDIPEAINLHRVDGRKDVEESFKAVFAATREKTSGPPYLHIVPKNVNVQRFGDAAIVSFEFERGTNSFGRRTIVFHHEHASWKIVHIHASNVEKSGRSL